LAYWIKITRYNCLLFARIKLPWEDIHRLKVKGWKMLHQESGSWNK
jgi:hypothetical protein